MSSNEGVVRHIFSMDAVKKGDGDARLLGVPVSKERIGLVGELVVASLDARNLCGFCANILTIIVSAVISGV